MYILIKNIKTSSTNFHRFPYHCLISNCPFKVFFILGAQHLQQKNIIVPRDLLFI